MKDEIKEILDNLKDIDKTSILKNNDAKILLDYITNLQKERNMFKGAFETMTENYFEENKKINKAIEKLYCYGEIFDGKILQQFQKEMLETLQGKSDE